MWAGAAEPIPPIEFAGMVEDAKSAEARLGARFYSREGDLRFFRLVDSDVFCGVEGVRLLSDVVPSILLDYR